MAPVIGKDRSDVLVGKTAGSTALSGTPRELEQGINEVLSHLERTVETYEQKLADSQASNTPGDRGRGITPPSAPDSQVRAPSAAGSVTQDPEKSKKFLFRKHF